MTFVLSQIDKNGIIMASDSSETQTDIRTGKRIFVEVDKTLYFEEINIGVSTWGDAEIGDQGINEWLNQAVQNFKSQFKGENVLQKITTFLAEELDKAFGLDGNRINSELHMGLHVAGYNTENSLPGMCHVFIEPGFSKFDPQMTMIALPNSGANFHLRNGMYEEFAIMWPALSGIDASFRSLMAVRYQDEIEQIKDPVSLQAEWLGNWVKQMCLVIKTAGLPEYIGKTVKILTFNSKKNVRWFHLPMMKELK